MILLNLNSFTLAAVLLLCLQLLSGATTGPLGVHTAIHGDDGMAISWSTVAPLEKNAPLVRYGLISGELASQASGESRSYLDGATVHHHVVLSPILLETTYYYQICVEEDNSAAVGAATSTNGTCVWSKEYFFTSPPSSNTRSLNFAVFGDLGESHHGHHGGATLDWLSTIVDDISLVWVPGDVGYADDSWLHPGCLTRFCYEEIFDSFMEEISAKGGASRVPWMVTPGNHEADCHDPACMLNRSYRESLWNFTAYNARFKMPSDAPSGGNSNMWYSFNAGPAHFISLDLETAYPGAAEEKRYVFKSGGFSGDMIEWLKNDLAAVNRTQHPWVMVAGHHPMYSNGSINVDMQVALEDILHEYQVDIMFTGHMHSCEYCIGIIFVGWASTFAPLSLSSLLFYISSRWFLFCFSA